MKKRISYSAIVSFLFALVFLLYAASPASGDHTYWQHDPATPGDWHDPANWDNGIPTSSFDYRAYIDNDGTAQIFLDAESYCLYTGYDNSATVEQFGGINRVDFRLYLAYSSGSSGTYNLGNGELLANSECIGDYGTGVFNQTGGTHTVDDYLRLGRWSGSSGTYNLSGTGELSAVEEYIGDEGTGEFNQTGGTHTVGYLYVKDDSSYNLSSGTLSISNSAEINGSFHFSDTNWALNVNGGLANFTNAVIDGAGSASFSSAANTLTILPTGFNTAQFGSYNAQGLVHNAGSTLVISAGEGFEGHGWIDDHVQVQGNIVAGGGPLDFRSGLTICDGGILDSSSFEFKVDNGQAVTIAASGGQLTARSEYIGYEGAGQFNQDAGIHTIGGYLYLGRLHGSSGTYNLSDGTLSVGDSVNFGPDNTNELNQTGGSLNTYYLWIGSYGGRAIYNWSGGTITANSIEVGWGGVLNVEQDWAYSGSYLNMEGGTLDVSSHGLSVLSGGVIDFGGGAGASCGTVVGEVDFAGEDGALFVHSNATADFSNTILTNASAASFTSESDTLVVVPVGFDIESAFGSTSIGGMVIEACNTYVIGAGESLTAGFAFPMAVEIQGTLNASSKNLMFFGGVTIRNGGTLDYHSNDMYVEHDETVTIENGGLVKAISQYIGYHSYKTGTLHQEGGTNSVADGLTIGGRDAYSSGTYIQTGGINSVGNYLILGSRPDSSGTYILDDGELSVGYDVYVGKYGTGEFNQSGGTHTNDRLYIGDAFAFPVGIHFVGLGIYNQTGGTHLINNFLYLGSSGNAPANSEGTYNLEDGDLSVGRRAYIGERATGVFNQTGGAFTAGEHLYLGYYSDSDGTYNLIAGELSVGIAGNVPLYWEPGLYVGNSGTGQFNQTGGTNTVIHFLYLGYESGSSGTYNMSAGELSVGYDEYIGYSGTGVFNQTGGVNQVADTLYIAYDTDSSGSYHILAGDLIAYRIIIGEGGYFANNGSIGGGTIVVGDDFINNSLHPDLFSLTNTTLKMWGGTEENPSALDMNSVNLGDDCAGLVDNFALGTLIFGGSSTGGEFFYRLESDVYTYGLVLNEGATLNLNGYTLYYLPFGQSYCGIATTTQCLDGAWYGGDIVPLTGGTLIPEPGTIAMIGAAVAGLAGIIRRRFK